VTPARNAQRKLPAWSTAQTRLWAKWPNPKAVCLTRLLITAVGQLVTLTRCQFKIASCWQTISLTFSAEDLILLTPTNSGSSDFSGDSVHEQAGRTEGSVNCIP